ncbi:MULTISPECIES: tetratricopeptide repeat protein [Flavobacterium]|uniref:tetratricopeptide repeat protein n=1 Tax=Flavobacterium TaxID=237 RepID=UPI001FCC594B|nr:MULTISPECIES: tetratricopeptide repeat protein [Flavobacterium]UOK43688.1 tetratricopeptide repeat protein [Flavobacterium enshiense]
MRQIFFFLFFPLLLSAQSDFDKGKTFFEEKKYTLAKLLFENYARQKGADPKATEYLGDIAAHQNQWDAAIGYYKKLKTQFPKNADYHYKFGGALGMKAKESNKIKAFGMIDEIKKAFETAARLDSKHVDTRWALVVFYIELPGIVGGSEAKAQKYAGELQQLSKVDGYLAKGYIDVYFKRYVRAEANLKKAHEIGHSKTTFEKLYDLYLNKLKDVEKAKKLKGGVNT